MAQKTNKKRIDYSYKDFDKQIATATKCSKSTAVMRKEPFDTPLKLYIEQGYKTAPLEDFQQKVLSVHGFDINATDGPILNVTSLVMNGQITRAWVAKANVPYTDWAPAISPNVFDKLCRLGWTSHTEMNSLKLPRNYYPSFVKNNVVWNQPIGFQNGKCVPLKREKVKILGVEPSRYIGVYGPEFRVYSFKNRVTYYCNQILLTAEEDTQIDLLSVAVNTGIDFMDFLFFGALQNASKAGADIGKVIECGALPKYLNIESVWFQEIGAYSLHAQIPNVSVIQDDLCVYYLSLSVRNAIDKHKLQTKIKQSFPLTNALYNVRKYGLMTPLIISDSIIDYCRRKNMELEYTDKIIQIKIFANQLRHLNMTPNIKYIGYSKIIVPPFMLLTYIRKCKSFMLSFVTLRTRN